MNGNSRPDRVVVIGASAGGVEALQAIAGGLPADFPAPVLVVLHVPPETSHLPSILARAGSLPAEHAQDGEPLRAGKILVAPPDRHLMVQDGRVQVVRGPKENMHRPAVDPLFRSAALAYGPNAVAVVLSGTRADGAAGAAAVAHRGGAVVVQDPGDAVYPDMPMSAIAADHPDYVLPTAEIPATISRLVSEPAKEVTVEDAKELETENRYAALDENAIERAEGIGRRGPFGCPECGGVLWEQDDGSLLRYRCRVGHAYAAETLLEAQAENLETALFIALRALEERANLSRQVRDRLRARGVERTAKRYDEAIEESERHANIIRAVLSGQSEAA
jgi:two-component system, chemotaxis family, protein-glutamate methylesterase/glutaminase